MDGDMYADRSRTKTATQTTKGSTI